MKDIALVRSGLEKIRNALLSDGPPRRPSFGGIILEPIRSDLGAIEEPEDAATSNFVMDLRDEDSLFRELDRSVKDRGIEALAWYRPFHISADKWGIYIPITSIHYGAEHWFSSRMRRSRRVSLALNILLNHEIIHYACEYTVAQYELFLQVPCWAAARERLRASRLDWFDEEEALANANSIRQIAENEASSIVDQVHKVLLQSPPGYRDFPSALSNEGFHDHILEVLRHNVGIPAADLESGFLDLAFDASKIFPDLNDALGSCPLYLVDDAGKFAIPRLSSRQIACIPEIVETNRFQRKLRKLDPRRQEEWQCLKEEISVSLPRHPKFKKLGGQLQGYWGLYLGEGFRAHIRPIKNGPWEAVEIGSHKEMGHG